MTLATYPLEDKPVQYDVIKVDRLNIDELVEWLGATYVSTDHQIAKDEINWLVMRRDNDGNLIFDLRIEEGNYVLRSSSVYTGRRTRQLYYVQTEAQLEAHFRTPNL